MAVAQKKYQHVKKTPCISVSTTNTIILLLFTNKLNHTNKVFCPKKMPDAKGKQCRLAIMELIGRGT